MSERLQQRLSRRELLGLGGALLASHMLKASEVEEEFSYERLSELGHVGVAHNAGLNPWRYDKYLNSHASILELDVLPYEGELVVGHDMRQFETLPDEVKAQQLLEPMMNEAYQVGKVCALDKKGEASDLIARQQFNEVIEKVEEVPVVVFGKDWNHLDELVTDFPNVFPAHTINSRGGLHDFFEELPNFPNREAVSLEKSLATPKNLSALKENGIYVYVWTVNDPRQVLSLEGADAIISDKTRILNAFSGKV